jgi:DNA ligase 1
MGSPAKRRKRNDHDTPAKAGRGIDYFFSKRLPNQADGTPNQQQSLSEVAKDADNPSMTDEELARKLQLEWNREYQNNLEVEKGIDQNSPKSKSEESPSGPVGSKESKGKNAFTENLQPQLKTLALQSTANDEDIIASGLPFDENPLSFEPSKYIPELQRYWAAQGGYATYAILTRCFVLVNSTASRIKIVDTLVNMLRVLIQGDSESLLPAVRSHLKCTT